MNNSNVVKSAILKITILTTINLLIMGGLISWLSYRQSDKNASLRTAQVELALLQSVNYRITQVQQYVTDASLTKDEDSVKQAKENYDKALEAMDQIANIDPENKGAMQTIKENTTELNRVGEEMYSAYKASGDKAGNEVMKRPNTGFDAKSDILRKSMDELVPSIEKREESILADVSSLQKAMYATIIIMTIVSLGLLNVGIRIFLKKALLSIAEVAGESSTHVSDSAEEISKLSHTLSSAVTQAAVAVKETEASLNQIANTLARNTELINKNASLVSEARNGAEKGVSSLVSLDGVVGDINKKSKEITAIVDLVDDIAFQTNLLALNAAVEAARAGSAGAGFAVVADAVRSLSQKSAEAAKSIKVLIDETSAKIQEGTKLSSNTMADISMMVMSLEDVALTSGSIADLGKDVEAAIGSIQIAMGEIDKSTQSNAASSNELAGSAEQASSEAVTLNDLVAKMKQAFGE